MVSTVICTALIVGIVDGFLTVVGGIGMPGLICTPVVAPVMIDVTVPMSGLGCSPVPRDE